MAIMQFVMAVLATYRLAHLFPEDDGPAFIFRRIRTFTGRKADEAGNPSGFWANIDEGINCVYCCGIYMGLLVTGLLYWQNPIANIFLLWFALTGGQSLLQKLSTK